MSSLYIHIPFCEKKCFYCSFAVAINQHQHKDRYMECLKKEIEFYDPADIKTLYIGGGTPTTLSCSQISCLVGLIKKKFTIEDNAEITIEANPENIDPDMARCLLELGFNRVSLGVQSFSDDRLRYLGRCHDSSCVLDAFRVLRDSGFSNISVDMIYGFEGQTRECLENDLDTVISLGCEHLSLYSLSIEEKSLFYVKNTGLSSDKGQADFYKIIVEKLENKGYHQYEISNFERVG